MFFIYEKKNTSNFESNSNFVKITILRNRVLAHFWTIGLGSLLLAQKGAESLGSKIAFSRRPFCPIWPKLAKGLREKAIPSRRPKAFEALGSVPFEAFRPQKSIAVRRSMIDLDRLDRESTFFRLKVESARESHFRLLKGRRPLSEGPFGP